MSEIPVEDTIPPLQVDEPFDYTRVKVGDTVIWYSPASSFNGEHWYVVKIIRMKVKGDKTTILVENKHLTGEFDQFGCETYRRHSNARRLGRLLEMTEANKGRVKIYRLRRKLKALLEQPIDQMKPSTVAALVKVFEGT